MSEERELLERAINYLRGEGKLITDIDALLAKPKPEPIGYINPIGLKHGSCMIWKEAGCNGTNVPVYIASPPRKELSDDEITTAVYGIRIEEFDLGIDCDMNAYDIAIARAVLKAAL